MTASTSTRVDDLPNPSDGRGLAALQAALTVAQVEHGRARGEIERLTDAFQALVGSILAAQVKNTPEYMAGLADDINTAAWAFGETDRVTFNGHGFRIVRTQSATAEVAQ